MASRVAEWHVYTQWHCCPECRQLWTFHGKDLVALDRSDALGPACPSEDVTSQYCLLCKGPTGAIIDRSKGRSLDRRGMIQ
jgi:hypothetical protein